MVIHGYIAGGYWCSLLATGLAIALLSLLIARPLRKRLALAWTVGLFMSAATAGLFGVASVYATHDATFYHVFNALPPPGIWFSSGQRTVALSDGAALVVIDDISRGELELLLTSGHFTREIDREKSIANAADPQQALIDVASGTRFLNDVTPTPEMEIYRSVRNPTYWSYVVYMPLTERAYAFWLEF